MDEIQGQKKHRTWHSGSQSCTLATMLQVAPDIQSKEQHLQQHSVITEFDLDRQI